MADNIPAEVLDRVHDCLRQGNKLAAVKELVDGAQMSLLDAKNYVENLSDRSESVPPGDHAGVEITPEIRDCLFAGNKIEAVRQYAKMTNKRLKEAKADIDRVEAELREQQPERFAATKGCLGLLLVAATILGAILLCSIP